MSLDCQFLLPLAKQLNRLPLPTFSQAYTHILLPPANQMLGHVNFNLVPNRNPGASEGLYEAFEDDDDEDGWGSEDQGSEEDAEETVKPGQGAGMGTISEEDGDDVDGMDTAEDVKLENGVEERGQKRSIDETE